MTDRRALYVETVAAALASLPTEHRRAAWADLESRFIAEYRRAHPDAREADVNSEFLQLAKAISARRARPTLRLPTR